MTGTLYGIGVGPGDPELLTLKAVRLLRAVPVIAYLAPLEGAGMAHGIAAPHLPGGQTEIVLRMGFDHAAPPPDDVYDHGAEAIAAHLAEGRDVGVLCEGDPFFFGSFVYVFARLHARFAVEVVPGITSMAACSALAGAPLTARQDALAAIPATRAEAEIEQLLAAADSAAIMKLGRHLPKVRRVLDRLDLGAHATLIERAGLPGQRIRPLTKVAGEVAPYFSMILVHKRGRPWK